MTTAGAPVPEEEADRLEQLELFGHMTDPLDPPPAYLERDPLEEFEYTDPLEEFEYVDPFQQVNQHLADMCQRADTVLAAAAAMLEGMRAGAVAQLAAGDLPEDTPHLEGRAVRLLLLARIRARAGQVRASFAQYVRAVFAAVGAALVAVVAASSDRLDQLAAVTVDQLHQLDPRPPALLLTPLAGPNAPPHQHHQTAHHPRPMLT